MAEWWYNSSYHSSTKMTPFEAPYGYQAPTLTHYIPNTTQNAAVASQLKSRDKILETLKHNLQAAQERNKCQYDKQLTKIKFDLGDWVYLCYNLMGKSCWL